MRTRSGWLIALTYRGSSMFVIGCIDERTLITRRWLGTDRTPSVKRRPDESCSGGKREVEAVIAVGCDGHTDLAAVALDDLLTDGETEAGAASAALAASTVVGLEDADTVLDRDRRTLALDGEPPAGVVRSGIDADRPVVAGAVSERVEEQVREDDADQRLLAVDLGELGHLDVGAATLDLRRQQRQALAQHPVELDAAALRLLPLGAGIVQKRLDEQPGACGGSAQRVQVAT